MSKAKFKNVDFYRKIPKDMTEGTISGSVISMLAAAVIGLLLISEIGSYLTPKFDTRVVIDRSADGEMMRINFNVSFPALSCEFASVDVGDAMGLNRFNLTKTVFKRADRQRPQPARTHPVGTRPREQERDRPRRRRSHRGGIQESRRARRAKIRNAQQRQTRRGRLRAGRQILREREERYRGASGQLLRAVVPVVQTSRPRLESIRAGDPRQVPERSRQPRRRRRGGLH
jgi:hypothetical protein